jgi:hypothetical protein
MKPGKHNWEIYAGATFSEMVEWKEPDGTVVDLNLYTGLMEIRTHGNPGTLVLALSTANGRIQPQVDKRARLFIGDADTRVLPRGSFEYDLLFRRIGDGQVFPLLAGKARVLALVTRNQP